MVVSPMPFLNEYPQLKVIQAIARRQKARVYLVGGFLRDHCLKRPCFDMDFAVEKQAVAFARGFAKRIKGAFVLLDKEHGCARVVKKDKQEVRTFDFADFRATDIKGDIGLRDFTVNTLCVDINALTPRDELKDVMLDYRKAKADLKARTIRMVSLKSFQDDPLRLLRAYSLCAQLGFKIEPKTRARIKKERALIRRTAAERIREELFKILDTPDAARYLKDMDRAGLLEEVIPQVTLMYGVKQGTYHHLDVWKHSLETVAQLDKVLEEAGPQTDIGQYLNEPLAGGRTRRAVMKLAALLHDIGKPETRRKEKDRISFHGHEHVGKSIARSIAQQLKLSTRERFALQDMVRWHLRPGYLSNFKKPSERAVFRFMRDAKEEAAGIALLSLADQRSTRGPATTQADQIHHEKICRDLVKRYFDKKKEKPFVRLINGHDLIKELKLSPSPLFATILEKVEEDQVTGKVRTRVQALAAARKLADQGKS